VPGFEDRSNVEGLDSAIRSLVQGLASRDGMLRRTMRRSLVAIGEPAVDALSEAVNDKRRMVRWEAAKALGAIGSARGARALIRALKDGDFGVRWLGAEGLIALERKSLEPLLRSLIDEEDSDWLREGAHHVFSVLAERGLHDLVDPLLEALEGPEPGLSIVAEAHSALERIRSKEHRS
jgi:HEAT repeat protein